MNIFDRLLLTGAQPPKKFLELFATYMRKKTVERFENEGEGRWEKTNQVMRFHRFVIKKNKPDDVSSEMVEKTAPYGTMRRSGKLRAAWHNRVEGNEIVFYNNQPYAEIRHKGGTIRPTKAKYLTIPCHPKSAGKSVSEVKRTLKDNQRIIRIKNALYLVTSQKTQTKFEALYWLREQVEQKARPMVFLTPEDVDMARAIYVKVLHENECN